MPSPEATTAGVERSRAAAVALATAELSDAGVTEPRRTAELLLCAAAGIDRVALVTHPEAPLDPADAVRFRAAVQRRARGEPAQYIVGQQEFFGLELEVNRAVLIPRPETELVVEQALAAAAARRRGAALRFVDVGTGSGCIAIALAHAGGADWRGWGVDLSAAALAVARRNAARHGVLGRVAFAASDLLDAFAPRPAFELVVSNPPYVARRDAPALDAAVRDHEPHAALFGGESGLEVYERLLPEAERRLVAGGALVVELGLGQVDAVAALAARARLEVEGVAPDLQGIPRCLTARKPR